MNPPIDITSYEGAGFIFVNQHYDFLLVQDTESKKWGMCKGHRDPYDADPLETAQREALEELGLSEGTHYQIVSGPIFIQGSPRKYIFYYAMLHKTLNKFVLQTAEICDVKWVRYHDLPNTVCHRDEYNIYLRLLVSTTIGKPTIQQHYISELTSESSFVPKYRLVIKQPQIIEDEVQIQSEIPERTGSCILEIMNDEDEEDEIIVEPPPSTIEMCESYMFVPIHLDMVELLARSFSRPAPSPSPSPRPRACSSPFIPIGYSMASPRGDGRMSPFISAQ